MSQKLIVSAVLLGAITAILAVDEATQEPAIDVKEFNGDPLSITTQSDCYGSLRRPHDRRWWSIDEEDDSRLAYRKPIVIEPGLWDDQDADLWDAQDVQDAQDDRSYRRRPYYRPSSFRSSRRGIYTRNHAMCNGLGCRIVQVGYKRTSPCRGRWDTYCTPSIVSVENIARCQGRHCRVYQQDDEDDE